MSKLRALAIYGKIHFHIQVCIVKDSRCVFLIISLRYFIIVIDAFKLFAKIAIVLNKIFPMVRVSLIPNLSILPVAFDSLLHGFINIFKCIPYLRSHLLDVGDPLNG